MKTDTNFCISWLVNIDNENNTETSYLLVDSEIQTDRQTDRQTDIPALSHQ